MGQLMWFSLLIFTLHSLPQRPEQEHRDRYDAADCYEDDCQPEPWRPFAVGGLG